MNKYLRLSILILPIIFLWAGLKFDRKNYPNDPEYVYLMNALCICDGQSVGYIDHPGTTLIQFAAGTIELMHLFSNPNNETAVEHVLKEPNMFIEDIRKAMVVLNTIFLFLLGWLTLKKTSSIWMALFFQISMLFSTYILIVTWASLSPEPLFFSIIAIYVILVLYYYIEKEKSHWKYVISFALITGAGLATKATFLPLVLVPLFILPTVKKKLIYLLGIIPSFILFTIPAIPEYNRMFFWFRNLVNHSGIYGNGERGIIDTKTYFPNLLNILHNNPIIPIILSGGIIILCVGYCFRKKQNMHWDLKFLSGFLVAIIFGTLLVAKHYNGNHYLIPVLLLSGITLYFIIAIIKRILESKILNLFLLPGLVVISIGYIAWNHPREIITSINQYKTASREIESTNLWVEKNYGQYTPINYYIYSINKYTGLKFGNDYAKRKMDSYLKELFPKTYFYELSSDTYSNWDVKTTLDEIIETNGNKIILINGPADTSKIKEMEKQGFPLIQVYSGNAQNIFILDTLKYQTSSKDNLKQIDSSICLKDKRHLLRLRSEGFGQANAISSDQSQTESNLIKLQKSNLFAIDYYLKDIKEEGFTQTEVWRRSTIPDGYRMVKNNDSNFNFQSQNKTVKSDKI